MIGRLVCCCCWLVGFLGRLVGNLKVIGAQFDGHIRPSGEPDDVVGVEGG